MPLGIPHSKFLSWSEDDQDKALAWQRDNRERCNGCGTRQADWKRDRFAYVADVSHCPGCELLEMERANLPEGHEHSAAFQVFLVPKQLATAPGEG